MKNEEKFYNALKEIFIGAKVEGESGFINLMKIKSGYFENGVFPQLQKDIETQSKEDFREELFEKLYTFFQRYFSESGSVYFRYTPLHQNVYEKVYTDEKDVILFYKTQMLYYVKTDRIFKNLEIIIEGNKFFFDVSNLKYKKAYEKKEIIYEFKEVRNDGVAVFNVYYSDGGRKTKSDDILKVLKRNESEVSDETLEKAFKVFEKQSEVDYFINKNAKQFLQDQFNIWLYQYVFSGVSTWTEKRIKQLQVLKDIAFKIIDFISQFEDELLRIWNKPKFVMNSNYVVTFDRIFDRDKSSVLIEKILNHGDFSKQLAEWNELGIIDDTFKKDEIIDSDLTGKNLNKKYKFLPIDTKYFKDLELEILSLFDNLDVSLDGWLIKSENYQALNTILPKFHGKIQCIHIDPPYNTYTSGFLYANKFRHSSWLTMMENRLRLGIEILKPNASFLCHVDENEYERLKIAFDQAGIGDAGTIIWDKRNPMTASAGIALQHEYIVWRSNINQPIYMQNINIRTMLEKSKEIIQKHNGPTSEAKKEYANWIRTNPALSGGEKAYHFIDEKGRVYRSVSLRAPEMRTNPKFFKPLIHPVTGKPCSVPPNGFSRTPETLQGMMTRGEIIFGCDEKTQPNQKRFLTEESVMQLRSVVQDANKGKVDLDNLGLNFPYCHPVSLYENLIGAAVIDTTSITIDFFAGSGTTAHAVMNLNSKDNGKRKFIMVEMGDCYNEILIPRIKKLSYSLNWKDGKPQGTNENGAFFKYYELEQYEDTLKYLKNNISYEDGDLFNNPYADKYSQYVFLKDKKLLETLELDYGNDKVKVDLSKLYENIDIPETLSNLKGKWIKRITEDSVEFEDGEKINIKELDFNLIKPLIWWTNERH